MRKLSVLMVGIGGFGAYYLKELLDRRRKDAYQLVGAVDPYADRSEYGPRLRSLGVPIYSELEEFYRHQRAELAVIATPIYLHARQAEYCMEHGSDVLCEKPVCADRKDAEEMIAVQKRTSRRLAIGFQWSFSEGILQLKQDILNGIYGSVRRFRTITYMPRNLDYYQRGTGWAGKRRLESGETLLDSVACNAAAHYLHNMLFLTGNRMDRSADPLRIEAEVYRANPIEMFDTCALRIDTASQAQLMFYAASAVPKEADRPAEFVMEGEKGSVTLSYREGREVMKGYLADGRCRIYSPPDADPFRKLDCIRDAILKDTPLPCTAETAVPHVRCVCALAELFLETPKFPDGFIHYDEAVRQYTCKNLAESLDQCWRQGTLPWEENLPWAQKPRIWNAG